MEVWNPGDDLWTVDLFVTANLILVNVLYLLGVRILASRGKDTAFVSTYGTLDLVLCRVQLCGSL